jgi:hypothetical protein
MDKREQTKKRKERETHKKKKEKERKEKPVKVAISLVFPSLFTLNNLPNKQKKENEELKTN